MTTREKVMEMIQAMSEHELEAEYAHLRHATDQPAMGDELDELEDTLAALADISRRVNVSINAMQLVRDERDWLGDRVP